MAAKVYYDTDADLGFLEGKKLAVIGYGSQGHAHSLNLHDSEIRAGGAAARLEALDSGRGSGADR